MTIPIKLIKKFDELTLEMQQFQRYQQKPLKWFYNALIPKKIRRQKQKQAKLSQQQHLAQCWNELIGLYQQNQLPFFAIKPKKEFTHQKIIWQYWGQGIDGDLPNVVKLCFKSVDKYKADFIVIRLDDSNLDDYLEFPEFINQKRKNPDFRPVFFSDLLRIALLYHYGGVWIDATILLTNPLDNQFTNANFFVFQRSTKADNKHMWENFNPDYFSWQKEHQVNMLTSIMFAKKENSFIYTWLQLTLFFWKYQSRITHYFFFQILFNQLKENGYLEKDMLLIDDTLPHLLVRKLNQPFNEIEYNNILKQTNIHKLTYIKNCKAGSYYERLRQEILGLKI